MARRRFVTQCFWFAISAACGSAPPPEPSFSDARGFDPLQVCVTTSVTRHARSVTCRDTHLLFVSRADAPASLLEAKRATLAAYGIPVEDRSLLLGGHNVAGLGYYMGPFESASASVLFMPLPLLGTQESIDAQCYRRGSPVDPKRCSTLLDAFVNQGLTRGEWPSALSDRDPQSPVEFDLLGRVLRLPSSCDEVAPLELECKDAHLKLLVAETKEQLPRLLGTDQSVSSEGTLLRSWQAPCRVDGVEAQCELRHERLAFDELFSLRAALVLRDTPIMLACATKKSRSPQLPGAICGQLFELAADAFDEPAPTEAE